MNIIADRDGRPDVDDMIEDDRDDGEEDYSPEPLWDENQDDDDDDGLMFIIPFITPTETQVMASYTMTMRDIG